MIPQGIEITVDKQTKIVVNGPNREQVGQVAAKIRSFRPPEPYLVKALNTLTNIFDVKPVSRRRSRGEYMIRIKLKNKTAHKVTQALEKQGAHSQES